MFVTVKVNSNLVQGTLVCHESDNIWRQANSADVAPLGVLKKNTTTDDNGIIWGEVVLAGTTWARAGVGISSQGGWLDCDDQGRAIIGIDKDCGLVAPVSRGSSIPSVDDLVLVYIR